VDLEAQGAPAGGKMFFMVDLRILLFFDGLFESVAGESKRRGASKILILKPCPFLAIPAVKNFTPSNLILTANQPITSRVKSLWSLNEIVRLTKPTLKALHQHFLKEGSCP
jgi:hypothetical protein